MSERDAGQRRPRAGMRRPCPRGAGRPGGSGLAVEQRVAPGRRRRAPARPGRTSRMRYKDRTPPSIEARPARMGGDRAQPPLSPPSAADVIVNVTLAPSPASTLTSTGAAGLVVNVSPAGPAIEAWNGPAAGSTGSNRAENVPSPS